MTQLVPQGGFNLDVLSAQAADLERAILDAERKMMARSLHEFVRRAWTVVEPKSQFKDNWHIGALCLELEMIYHRDRIWSKRPGSRRIIFNVPPGMMKSLIVMVFFPAWVWSLDPRQRFLCASYGSVLSNRDNVRCRQLIESGWYQKRWPVQLSDDQNTKTRYNTVQNGWRFSTSVGGPGTGEHPDFILIDDPHSAQQAASEEMRRQALDWFDNTVSQRTGRSPAFILIMQRLHVNDLTGHLLKKGGWRHVRWPMRFEKCTCPTAPICSAIPEERCPLHQADVSYQDDPTDQRTTPGELLHPTFKSEEVVKQAELDLGPIDSAGQLQQRPTVEGGGLFKRAWFKIADQLPVAPVYRRCRGWDTAGTEKGGDYTCGVRIVEPMQWVKVHKDPGDPKSPLITVARSMGFYVVDVARAQFGPAGVDALIQQTAKQDGKATAIREEREGGGSGKAVTQARATSLAGFDYEEVILGTDKVTRSKPFRTQVEAGNVYLLRAPWNEAYIVELCAFPTADHDDQVDGSSCSFNGLMALPVPKRVKITLMPCDAACSPSASPSWRSSCARRSRRPTPSGPTSPPSPWRFDRSSC